MKMLGISRSFQSTVSALCYSIIRQNCQPVDLAEDFPHNEVVRFVLGQHRGMPDFLRLPVAVLTLIFDLWGIWRGGAVFHRQPHAVRWRQIESWKNSSFGFCRDLMRFYESLVIFCWYSRGY